MTFACNIISTINCKLKIEREGHPQKDFNFVTDLWNNARYANPIKISFYYCVRIILNFKYYNILTSEFKYMVFNYLLEFCLLLLVIFWTYGKTNCYETQGNLKFRISTELTVKSKLILHLRTIDSIFSIQTKPQHWILRDVSWSNTASYSFVVFESTEGSSKA